ncbi:MAG: cation diffusion facilitator family transporter [Firmicutes bacterium]|nr:cation diffusion facilitator family transporter [Bacillota bacterium]
MIKISIITIIVNLILVVAKTIVGVLFNNLSVLSDAIHSGTDFITSFIIIGAVFLSNPKRDKDHNYGHEKVEPLVVLLLALIIGVVGVFLGYEGVMGILAPQAAQLNWYLIGVVIFSILIKEWMFHYEMHYAKKINSEILKADAWHSRSDSLASVAVLIGLIGSVFIKTNILESIAVIIVALFIIKVAIDIAIPAVNQLIDKSADEETVNKIKEITKHVEGVLDIDLVRTRIFGNAIYVDIDIVVDGNLTTTQSHNIAQVVHDTLESKDDLRIKHCIVHVNPAKE